MNNLVKECGYISDTVDYETSLEVPGAKILDISLVDGVIEAFSLNSRLLADELKVFIYIAFLFFYYIVFFQC